MTKSTNYKIFQSGSKSSHSTETTFLRVTIDQWIATDSGHVSIFILLNLSLTYNFLEHSFLAQRLRTFFGLLSHALK